MFVETWLFKLPINGESTSEKATRLARVKSENRAGFLLSMDWLFYDRDRS